MFKKILFAALIVTLVAAPVSRIAFAQDDTPPGLREGDRPRRGKLGQVTAIGQRHARDAQRHRGEAHHRSNDSFHGRLLTVAHQPSPA